MLISKATSGFKLEKILEYFYCSAYRLDTLRTSPLTDLSFEKILIYLSRDLRHRTHSTNYYCYYFKVYFNIETSGSDYLSITIVFIFDCQRDSYTSMTAERYDNTYFLLTTQAPISGIYVNTLELF